MIHPDFLFAKLTKEQFEEWLAFDSISPIGHRRRDLSEAIQTYWITQSMAGNADTDPQTFLPQFAIHDNDDWSDESPFDQQQREAREMDQFR